MPLAAQYPQPAEFHAVRLVLAVQFVGSAILFPVLCRGWAMTAATIASGFVLLLVGAALAGWALWSVTAAMGLIGLWILALWLWDSALPTARAQALVAACAATFVAGGAVLWYFQIEANGGAGLPLSLANGPLELVLSNPQSPPPAAWWCVGIVLAAGAVARTSSFAWAWHLRRSTASR